MSRFNSATARSATSLPSREARIEKPAFRSATILEIAVEITTVGIRPHAISASSRSARPGRNVANRSPGISANSRIGRPGASRSVVKPWSEISGDSLSARLARNGGSLRDRFDRNDANLSLRLSPFLASLAFRLSPLIPDYRFA